MASRPKGPKARFMLGEIRWIGLTALPRGGRFPSPGAVPEASIGRAFGAQEEGRPG